MNYRYIFYFYFIISIPAHGINTFIRVENKEIVLDNKTTLIWQDNYAVNKIRMNWYNAKTYCNNLELAGYSNWRLPLKLELLSIVDQNRYNPSTSKVFIYVNSKFFWSVSTHESINNDAWFVYFFYGRLYFYDKSSLYYVRCVTDGK